MPPEAAMPEVMHEEVDPDVPINAEATLTGVHPESGPFHGGNEVTISGTALLAPNGLGDVHQVLVGGVPAHRVISASPNEIRVVLGRRSTRIHNPGPAAVAIVSHTKGLTTAPRMYVFNPPPRIVAIRPDNGPHDGHNEIVIRGRHLTGGKKDEVKVLLDGTACKIVSQSRNKIRVVAAPSKHHSRRHQAHIVVHSQTYGVAKLHHGYTYNPAPVVTHVSPAEGPYHGGNTLRIHGDMITAGEGRSREKVAVTVGGKPAQVLSFSPNSVLVKAPPANKAGLVNIQVSSSRHGRSTKQKAYKYNARPIITSIKPAGGRAEGGDHVVIRGHHLGKGDVRHVFFGSRRARVLRSAADGTEVLVQTRRFSEAEEGNNVRVRLQSTVFGDTTYRGFRVGKRGLITGVTPRDGPCEGHTRVTITGKNLVQGDEADGDFLAKVAGAPAKVISHDHKKGVVVETSRCPSGAARDVIMLSSPRMGRVSTPFSIKYTYNPLATVSRISPEVGAYSGGAELLLQGEHLCGEGCTDLVSVRIGNAVIKKFKAKSSRRVILTAPSAAEAGGPGEKTVVVHSRKYGRTVVPRGFTINDVATRGAVFPSNVPIEGGETVTIAGPNLGLAGGATEYGVVLAGVPARIVSAAPNRLIVTAGDARKSQVWRNDMATDGLSGEIVVTAKVNGKVFAKDLGLTFRYNGQCGIDAVAARPGARAGTSTVLLAGKNMGFGDERIFIDGAPALVHRRERRGANIYRHHVTVPHMGGVISTVEVTSGRGGRCTWHRSVPAANASPAVAPAGVPAAPPAASPGTTPAVRQQV